MLRVQLLNKQRAEDAGVGAVLGAVKTAHSSASKVLEAVKKVVSAMQDSGK